MTERERILERREDFMAGVTRVLGYTGIATAQNVESFRQYAEGLYPLPKITRPREVDGPPGTDTRFRVADGYLQQNVSGSEWYRVGSLATTGFLICMAYDLFRNPDEEVEDDGASSPSLPGASS